MSATFTGAGPRSEKDPGQGVLIGTAKNSRIEFSYPRPDTVNGRVLADLLSGYRITHLDVWERHGSSRAAHHVLMLRKAGWPVITREIEVPTSDGRRAQIAEYMLPQETIEAAGDGVRTFLDDVSEARRSS